MSAQVKLREEMSEQYGVDLCSKSDAQIAEAVMKVSLPFKVERPALYPGATFHYRPPAWMSFVKQPLLDLLARNPFMVTAKGGVEMTQELADTVIVIGNGKYKMGIGGLHSMEQQQYVQADDTYQLTDHDVASMYPSIILVTGIYPPQIGPAFQEIYRGWVETRLKAKTEAARLKKEIAALKKSAGHGIAELEVEFAKQNRMANTYKIVANGTFGKLGNQYSIFYAPSEMIQVTLTGQLALLMLIERMELAGLRVISANTDGIVIRSRRDMQWVRDDILRWWEQTTGFVTEESRYKLVASRDVNSYVAITTDGSVKLKGAFAPPEPGPSGWPNPTTQVCVDAVVACLRDGVPLAATILSCRDVRQFVSVRKVKGGGYYAKRHLPRKGGTRAEMRRLLGDTTTPDKELRAAYERELTTVVPPEFLGKVVRWYYSRGSTGCIVTDVGNLVAKTEGCSPMMQLTAEVPEDLDYEWYIREAASMLRDAGVLT
jgi:hypothetical protein